MSNACGLVTSWIRCRPTKSCVCPFGSVPHGVRVPDLLEERRGHWAEWYYAAVAVGIAGSRSGPGLGTRGLGGWAGARVAARLGIERCLSSLEAQRSGRFVAVSATRPIRRAAESDVRHESQIVRRFGTSTPGRRRWICRVRLSSWPAASADRALRTERADAPRCGVDPVERRGRTQLRHGRPVPQSRQRSRLGRWRSWRRSSRSRRRLGFISRSRSQRRSTRALVRCCTVSQLLDGLRTIAFASDVLCSGLLGVERVLRFFCPGASPCSRAGDLVSSGIDVGSCSCDRPQCACRRRVPADQSDQLGPRTTDRDPESRVTTVY